MGRDRRRCCPGRRWGPRRAPVFSALRRPFLAGVVASVTLTGTWMAGAGVPAGAAGPVSVGPVSAVSEPCTGQNAEVEQAVDPSGPGYVYEAWTGCDGIGYARSTNGGASFGPAVTLPGSVGFPDDPVVAVGPSGTVYIAFMVFQGGQNYPVVDTSFDHGVTFPQETSIIPPDPDNWGDSPNIAVGPDGTVYITWDYGPSSASVVTHCTPGGSCAYAKGDLNVVIQKSTDGAKTFGPIVSISPGYPWSGADNAPIAVDSSGRLDVVFQDYPTNPKTHTFKPALNYFTSSGDGGATWTTPVAVGADQGTMSTPEWWNEPSLGIDAGGHIYVAWDTQGKTSAGLRTDTGWLSYSADGGTTWSVPVQAPTEDKNDPHIMEVAGGASGKAYVEWLTDSTPSGYSLYLRPFSIAGGWLSAPVRVSTSYGNRAVWPGDTLGLSVLGPTQIVVSWGNGLSTTGPQSVVDAAPVSIAV